MRVLIVFLALFALVLAPAAANAAVASQSCVTGQEQLPAHHQQQSDMEIDRDARCWAAAPAALPVDASLLVVGKAGARNAALPAFGFSGSGPGVDVPPPRS